MKVALVPVVKATELPPTVVPEVSLPVGAATVTVFAEVFTIMNSLRLLFGLGRVSVCPVSPVKWVICRFRLPETVAASTSVR